MNFMIFDFFLEIILNKVSYIHASFFLQTYSKLLLKIEEKALTLHPLFVGFFISKN